MQRSWQKFDELQHNWAAREKELADEVGRYKADALFANSIMEENAKLKTELETARMAASEATKEAKERKKELRTCRLDRDYHADVANQKTFLANTLQNYLQAQTTRCEQLTAEMESLKEVYAMALVEVESLKEFNAKASLEHAEEIEDVKDAIKICFYMFWEHNMNADFSYLGDAYAADEADFLARLVEEEAEEAAKNAAPQDPQT